ncbi:MAG: hypothetical protein Q8O61_03810 [Nocardioides sp.]|nr:hypothetical protein [Nocardioides sp.]
MKQLIASVVLMLTASIGLVAGSSTAANAAPCPYTGCFNTNTHVSGSTFIKRHAHPRVTIRVTVEDGNVRPKGFMRLIFKRVNGGYWRSRNVYYNGSVKTLVGPRLHRPGRYEVIARFKAQAPFKASGNSYGLLVSRRR